MKCTADLGKIEKHTDFLETEKTVMILIDRKTGKLINQNGALNPEQLACRLAELIAPELLKKFRNNISEVPLITNQ